MMWYIVGSMAAVLTMFGFVPQIVKMIKTESVRDVSLGTLIQFSIGVFCWLLYGIHLEDIIIITANGVILVSLIIAMIVYSHYG